MGSPIEKQLPSEEEVLDITPVLNGTKDRCDRCGAQAFVLVEHEQHSSLLFCGHHYSKHEDTLILEGWISYDFRSTINEKPSVSASALDVPEAPKKRGFGQ